MRRYIDTSVGQVHCRDDGAGDPLVLLHQSGRSGRMFRAVAAILAQGRRVIVPDLPGFGMSDPAPDGFDIDGHADLLVEVLDGLDVARADLYGHHSGNKIATAFAGRHPHRLHALILGGQSHSLIPDAAERNAAIEKFVSPYRVERGTDPQSERHAKAFRELTAAWWAPGLAAAPQGEAEARARDIALDALQGQAGAAALYAANLRYDLGAGYRDIRAPTLVIEIVSPTEDALMGRQAAAVAALIPSAVTSEITHPDEDGSTLEDRAGELAEVIGRFLRKRLKSGGSAVTLDPAAPQE